MGGNPSEIGCLVCFIPGKFAVESLVKEGESRAKKSEEKKGFLNIILGEVGFICFLRPINFLMAFV